MTDVPVPTIKVSESVLAAARDRFNASFGLHNHPISLRATFDEIVSWLWTDDMSLRAMGERANVTKQRMSQIVQRWFREVTPGNSPAKRWRKRQKRGIAKKHATAERDHLDHVSLRDAVYSARQHKCKPEAVSGKDAPFLLNRLRISKKLCAVSHLSAAYCQRNNGQSYANTQMTKKSVLEVDFVIFIVHRQDSLPRIFVVPAHDLLMHFFSPHTNGVSKTMVLPVDKREINPHARRVNWWLKYENAWNLVSCKKPHRPVPS